MEARAIQCGDASLAVDAPLKLDDASALSWDRETDVLVAGAGAAGIAAALQAREAGAAVLIVDRFDLGGATARSGGVVYAGGGTPQQRAAGFDDTPEAMFNYLSREVGDAVSPDTLRRFCEDSRELLQWLESLGAAYHSAPKPPKTSYPKNGVYLYYSGNEGLAGFKEYAKPAPRGHRTVDKGLSGSRLYAVLRAAVERASVPVLGQSAVRRLIQDAQGHVIGVELAQLPAGSSAARRFRALTRRAEFLHNVMPGWADRLRARAMQIEQQHARTVRIRARRGVVLATGGFMFNRQMLARYAPKYLPNMRLGTAGCDGSGIRLGESVGAAVARMDKVSAWRFINPPTPWVRGIVVNRQGERFCNEASYGARLGVAISETQDGRAWLILDKALRRLAWREVLTGGLWIFQSGPAFLLMLMARRAKSLEALAARLGIPADRLRQTVDDYNRAADGRGADALGKDAGMLAPLRQPGFTAISLAPDNPLFPCPAITLGGLKVDETSGQVLNADGQPIGGLYAAGRAAVGVASNAYVSGLSLADCLWSGRRAGRAMSRDD